MHESHGYVEQGWDATFYLLLSFLTNGCKSGIYMRPKPTCIDLNGHRRPLFALPNM